MIIKLMSLLKIQDTNNKVKNVIKNPMDGLTKINTPTNEIRGADVADDEKEKDVSLTNEIGGVDAVDEEKEEDAPSKCHKIILTLIAILYKNFH